MKNIQLTIKECRVICECLWDFKVHIEEMDADTLIQKANIKFKIDEVDKLFIKMQVLGEWDFEKQLEKCSKKKVKSDVGEESLMLTNGYKK